MKLNQYFASDSPKCSLRLIGVMFLLVTVCSVCHTQACGTGKVRQERESSLRRSGQAALNAIEQSNTEALLRYVDSSGISFGPDKTPLSQKTLRNQFTHKEGAYCLFFSTECIPSMSHFKGLEPDDFLAEWRISYRDWLRAAENYSTYAELVDDGGVEGCGGDFFAETQKEMKDAPKEIELDFAFYKGRWWLSNTIVGVP